MAQFYINDLGVFRSMACCHVAQACKSMPIPEIEKTLSQALNGDPKAIIFLAGFGVSVAEAY